MGNSTVSTELQSWPGAGDGELERHSPQDGTKKYKHNYDNSMRGSCNYVLWTMTRKLESKDSLSSSGEGAVHTNNSYRCSCLVINMPKALW